MKITKIFSGFFFEMRPGSPLSRSGGDSGLQFKNEKSVIAFKKEEIKNATNE